MCNILGAVEGGCFAYRWIKRFLKKIIAPVRLKFDAGKPIVLESKYRRPNWPHLFIMRDHCPQLGLIQLVAISVCAFLLISLPQLALLVAAVVGVSLAFSMASAIAVGHYYSAHNIEKLTQQHASLLGTHFGGMLCYLIMIGEAFKYIGT